MAARYDIFVVFSEQSISDVLYMYVCVCTSYALQVDMVEGFREANIRSMIAKHRSAPAAAKKGE